MKAERIKAAFEQGRKDRMRKNGRQWRYSDAERDAAYFRGYCLEARLTPRPAKGK